jgi:hypothetical protein
MRDEGTKTKENGEMRRRENDSEGKKKGLEEGERRLDENW